MHQNSQAQKEHLEDEQPDSGQPAQGTIYDVLDRLRELATSKADKGTRFERLAKAYFQTDPMWTDQFSDVWMWNEWAGNQGKHDTGIDLVAKHRDSDRLTAIQAKFYEDTTAVSKADIDTFMSASGKIGFSSRIVITTNNRWTGNAEDAIKGQQIPVQRIGLADLEASRIDWAQFSVQTPESLVLGKKKTARPHQQDAIDAASEGFQTHSRGKLVMACGTGKTLMSLRFAEEQVGAGGTVLYLVPSIALLSQSLREWVNDAEIDLSPLAVCSDAKVSKRSGALEDISVVDLALPATTNIDTVAQRLKDATANPDRMTVVFSTYQSLVVVAQAQKLRNTGPFDLVLCDEAHRTTGVTLTGEDESAFVRVHDENYLQATRRLYMTATPKLFDDAVKAKAGEADAVLCSMDDDDLYGPEFYRLGFGEAVSRNLLADYKVLVLAVDSGSVAATFQTQLANEDNELELDDYAKLIGCWNGLSKRGEAEHTFADDPAPMRRAVAFASNIKASKMVESSLPEIVDAYIETHDLDVIDDTTDNVYTGEVIRTAVHHVDGEMSALVRNAHIDWLKDSEADTARILSNARCLSEGVDVPSLDAVMFLSPRRSVVDVVQAVGRVMRKADGKKYGYIILPIAIPAGVKAEDALDDNARYQVVWDVLQALRAHDERFDAMVNKIDLNKARDKKINIIGVRDGFNEDGTERTTKAENDYSDGQGELPLAWPELRDLRDAIYARIVKKVGKRRYWETWASDVAKIAETHITRINTLLDTNHKNVAVEFDKFLEGLRGNLNNGITRTDAVEMLAQHLITRPVFDALFDGYAFAEHNPVAQAMEQMLNTLDEERLDNENKSLEKFYASVQVRAAGIDNAEARQRIIVELYDTFFATAFKRTVDKLGIVYTPIECVDFLLYSSDWVLREEFGSSLSAENVHILDGFTGTGTFIVRLIQSGLISPHDLARKFASELHANEFLLLAYYIAAVNIETAFHDQINLDHPGTPYVPFDGLVLTDTFQSYEENDAQDLFVLPANNERLQRQLDLPITVIVGNPPYSAGQTSANDNNANDKYESLDAAIRDTYASRSSAVNKNSLYDSYIRAIKWASLRIGERGVVAYITNGGWLDGNTAAGLRKCLVEEFSAIHILNLKGNMRSSDWKREGGQIFGSGSQATVVMFLLVKNPEHQGPGVVHYRDIGDYLTRGEKFSAISATGSFAELATRVITPNEDGDWLNQRSEDFATFISLTHKEHPQNGVFNVSGRGVETARDAWVYNPSAAKLDAAMQLSCASYAQAISGDRTNNPSLIKWSSSLEARLARGQQLPFQLGTHRKAMYRPFNATHLYGDLAWLHRPRIIERLFPDPAHQNLGFVVMAPRPGVPFATLGVNCLPDLSFYTYTGYFFARWSWEPSETPAGQIDFGDLTADATDELVLDGYRRVDNITDYSLTHFQTAYGGTFTKNDIFHYCYGLLHSSDYRTRYAADLKKMLPRIPLVEDPKPYVEAGRTLLKLHLEYETVDPYPLGGLNDLYVDDTSESAYSHYAADKMRYGKPTAEQKQAGERYDKSTLIYNSRITLTGIPEEAQRYMVGSRSALDWLIDRYRVKIDKPSGIKNDPNDWSRETEQPRYILDLVARIVTVSVETMQIVDGLPALSLKEAPGSVVANCVPAAAL